MKRIWSFYATLFIMIVGAFISLTKTASSPEKLILGAWEETVWQYEQGTQIQSDKSEPAKESFIHKAEIWHFYPDGTLILIRKDSHKALKWRIKGRGHILQLKHDDRSIENYNIDYLNDQTLVLNFESDIEVRGIAKLTFSKPNG